MALDGGTSIVQPQPEERKLGNTHSDPCLLLPCHLLLVNSRQPEGLIDGVQVGNFLGTEGRGEMRRVSLEWRVENNLSTDLTIWFQVLGVLRPQFTRAAGKKEEAGMWT